MSVTAYYRQFIEEEGLSFFDLDANKPPLVKDVCIVSGYPTKKNYYDHKKGRYAETCCPYHIQSFMDDPKRVQSISGDLDFHFALEVNKRRDFRDGITNKPIAELFDLHGMSGCGVWHMTRGQNEGFPACAIALAGFIVEDRDTRRDRQGMVKVVKIEAIRNVIRFARSKSKAISFLE